MLTDIFRATAAIQDVRMRVWEKLKSFNVWDWERNFFTGLVGRGSSSGGVTERLPFVWKPAIPGRIKMAWFISVECFRKKGNTFRGIPFSRFYWNSRKFVYHLFTITSARLFPRRQQCPRRRILSDESLLFQTVRDVTAVLFSRLLLTDFLQQSCSTQGEKDLSFGCRYLFYFCFHD